MNESVLHPVRLTSSLDRGLRLVFEHKLNQFTDGRLEVREGHWRKNFGCSDQPSLTARLEIHDPRTYRAVLFSGSIGAAEAYAQGWWSSDDLTTLVRIMARNRTASESLDGSLTRLTAVAHRAIHRLRSNQKRQSRRNIAAHYDLGNDFFSLFLDASMTYSCAVFPDSSSSLEEASTNKLELICRKLKLSPSDDLLEIGTGWGSFAIHAAKHYGCRVTTTTISREQYNHATAAIERAGLSSQINVLNIDYRDLPRVLNQQFDKLVSIEMIEAVGQQFLNQYFETCERLVKPGGLMLLQSIVIADELYSSYRRSVDFIQRYIFPGGFLPSVGDIRQRLKDVTAFQVTDFHDITDHYPRTLQLWQSRFRSNWRQLESCGYSTRLLRLWDYYFSYCEGGFLERTIGDVQLVLTKPGDYERRNYNS